MGKNNGASISNLYKNRRIYANEWDTTAKQIDTIGGYTWMCNLIHDKELVLEIGTGSGYSTLALVESGHSVISIDENIECLLMTKTLLKSKGIDCVVLSREMVQEKKGYYNITYYGIKESFPTDKVLLIQSDILHDLKLVEWLSSLPTSFDAIICWLIGTHNSRKDDLSILQSKIQDPAAYRERIQMVIGELSKKILKIGGIYNIVDRVPKENIPQVFSPSIKKYYETVICDNLELKNRKAKLYRNTTSPNEKELCIVDEEHNISKINPNSYKTYFVSMLFEKTHICQSLYDRM